ncbi:MAG: ROK family glucokinase [Oscillospiraceae bacterium]|nr:ROK family glucokinase [Candidatus Equicaccousia limihippi]
MYNLGIDLGGTNIAVGVVNDNYEIIAQAKYKTGLPRPYQDVIKDMAQAAKDAVAEAGLTLKDIHSIGIGCPGTVVTATGEVLTSNNLDWQNVPLAKIFKGYIDAAVYTENDANAAAYGEYLAGAGKGTKNFMAMTLGTGVGSGIIIDGKIYSGCNSAGGEFGHNVIVAGGYTCTCGRKGCLEVYASASGLVRQTKEAMLENKDSLMWQLAGDIDSVSGRTAYDGKRKGDKVATEVVENYQRYVAAGITNAVNTFQPDVLCIGGGISKEGDNILMPIIDIVKKERFSKNNPIQTEIKIATLNNDAGIIGAAMLYKLH